MSKGEENSVSVGPVAASIAQMVVELAATADRYGRDWRPTLAEFIQLRLERLQAVPEAVTEGRYPKEVWEAALKASPRGWGNQGIGMHEAIARDIAEAIMADRRRASHE